MNIRILQLLAGTTVIAACAVALADEQANPADSVKQANPGDSVKQAINGSTAFCLYELPADDSGKRRWLNLGIVQYVEFNRNELKIAYGGGNLGSGHEFKIPISSPAQLQDELDKIKRAAASCR